MEFGNEKISRGQYGRTLRVCRVDYARNFNSIQYPQRNVREYAEALIHEATHGLLFEKGIPYDEKNWERIERLCHLESYRFALHFEPGYADLFPGPYDPKGHRWQWESSFQTRLAAWLKRFRAAERANKQSSPKSAGDYTERATAHMQKHDYDKAIADSDQAIRLDPQFAAAFNIRGWAYMEKRDYDKAIVDYDHAIQLDPKYALRRGTAYLRKHDYDKAIADYDHAIQINPKSAQAYANRGTTYLRKHDYNKAIVDYDHAIQLNPRDATVYKNLAWLLATCPQVAFRNGKKAVEHATKACVLLEWKDPKALRTLAAACAEAEDFENAVKWESQSLGTPELIAKATLNAESRLSLYQAHKRCYEVK